MKLYKYIVVTLLTFLLQCTSAPEYVISPKLVESPIFGEEISIESPDDSWDSFAGYLINLAARRQLKESLESSSLFSKYNENKAIYSLRLSTLKIDQPNTALEQYSKIRVNYILVYNGEEIYNKSFEGEGTAQTEDHFMADARARISTQRAYQETIDMFFNDLIINKNKLSR